MTSTSVSQNSVVLFEQVWESVDRDVVNKDNAREEKALSSKASLTLLPNPVAASPGRRRDVTVLPSSRTLGFVRDCFLNSLGGAAIGAAIGSLGGPLGILAGGVVGAALGVLFSLITDKNSGDYQSQHAPNMRPNTNPDEALASDIVTVINDMIIKPLYQNNSSTPNYEHFDEDLATEMQEAARKNNSTNPDFVEAKTQLGNILRAWFAMNRSKAILMEKIFKGVPADKRQALALDLHVCIARIGLQEQVKVLDIISQISIEKRLWAVVSARCINDPAQRLEFFQGLI